MIGTTATKKFNNPAQLKKRFQAAAAQLKEKQEIVDKLETMAGGFLALDQSDLDHDDAPGSVAITDNKGMLAYAQARPFGGILSFDYLNESGPKVEEFSIEPDMMGTHYNVEIGGVKQSVYENGNGYLALMEEMQLHLPDDAGDSETPTEPEAPVDSDKPKESDK